MRALRVVAPGPDVLPHLRAALAGGDAILVGTASDDLPPADLPSEVEQRVALVVETSGSTGRPKRVALSADAVLANAGASESALGGPGQWVLALPTHYIAGLNVLVRSIAAQIDPVVVEGERFTAAGFLEATARMTIPERFTALVPAQLATLLDDPTAASALAGFQRVLVGGQAMPAALLERAALAGVRVTRSYGSSETSGGCVYDGSPIGQTEVRVVDGEVQLGGPTIAEGYLGDPALTAARFVDELGMRWFRTADAGTFEGGRLTVTGRLDDVIISGGVKVSLGAVERLLHANGFADAVVVGADDDRWGEVPVGFTALTDDPALAIAAIEAALGPAARPRVRGGSVIPLLPSGKPDRMTLRAKASE
jgi:O-succinylbenzoic acid--CoA ligase